MSLNYVYHFTILRIEAHVRCHVFDDLFEILDFKNILLDSNFFRIHQLQNFIFIAAILFLLVLTKFGAITIDFLLHKKKEDIETYPTLLSSRNPRTCF